MKAFPSTDTSQVYFLPEDGDDLKGMDLRDYFAVRAMQAMIGSDPVMENIARQRKSDKSANKELCRLSYEIADAMTNERRCGNANAQANDGTQDKLKQFLRWSDDNMSDEIRAMPAFNAARALDQMMKRIEDLKK